jgi:hypothetical protein
LISLGEPTTVITPPALRRERNGSNGWSPEAVSTMKCREFFRDCKSKRSYISTVSFEVKQNGHYLVVLFILSIRKLSMAWNFKVNLQNSENITFQPAAMAQCFSHNNSTNNTF